MWWLVWGRWAVRFWVRALIFVAGDCLWFCCASLPPVYSSKQAIIHPSIHPSIQPASQPAIHPTSQLLDEVAGFASSTWSRRSRRGSWFWFWAFDAAGISGRAACPVKSILRDHGLGPLRLGLGLSGDSQPAQMRPNAGTCQ